MKKRLTAQACERIDRSTVLNFQWQGKHYQGFAGDTLASAMLANGIDIVGRSFKFGRYRGIMAAGAEEPNALVTLETEGYHVPNARATEVELYAGLISTAGSGYPALENDIRSFLKPFHRFMPAGFYYKTFKWPQALWPWYEKNLRKLSGFSEVAKQNDAEHYDHQYHHVDLAVVGGGGAGMNAALQAANAGATVMLLDERNALGGELISECLCDNAPQEWLNATLQALDQHPNVSIMTRTTAFALHDFNLVLALERRQDHLPIKNRDTHVSRQRQHKIRAKQVILATGSHERPMMFANNDLPGVMLASAVRRYLVEYSVLCGETPVIAGNNDSIYALARDLLSLGIKAIIVDVREGYNANDLIEKGITIWQGYLPVNAKGKQHITAVQIAKVSHNGNTWNISKQVHTLSCDLLAVSGGFNPLVHLDCHTGAMPIFSDEHQAFMPTCTKPNRFMAGSVNAHSQWQACLADGAHAASKALAKLGFEVTEQPAPIMQSLNTAPFISGNILRNKIFIDMQNDVKASDIELAVRENYRSIEHIKRYTALGFGTDQGKTSNVNGIAIAAEALKLPMGKIGTTTFRPMYTPVTIGALAGQDIGDLLEPRRYTPMQLSHLASEAAFEVVGQWMRPWYFPQQGEDLHQSVQRECLATRNSLGMMDASTLGKIDIQGPDAREFLNRVYTNAWSKLAIGKCRYGLMLNEAGMIIDDGVTACISDNHFVMTTTTGGAAKIMAHLELWHQTEWPDLQVYLTSVTDHWATTAVVGPKARKLMQKLCQDIDFSPTAFPFMDWREGTIDDIPVRIMRISFSGELAYEINVQANYGRHIWEQVKTAGVEWDITPYGTESLHVLRAEKGYIIVGQDTDGSITPVDANMSWAIAKNKPYAFLGERSLSRSDTIRTDRKQLVGLYSENPTQVLPEGCQLVNHPEDSAMLGHVTSSYMSPILGRSIAMAVVKNGFERMGETIYARPLKGEPIAVTIVDSIFYDKAKEKLDGEV